MDNLTLRISIETHEQTGDVMAVYLQIRKGKSAKVKEYADGNVFADYDKHGVLLGMEILGPCKVSVLNQIAEVSVAKQFIKKVVPRSMIATA